MTTPRDFLVEAEDLLKGARSNEVRRRSVISRAYYGGFHVAEAMARARGYRFDPDAGQGRHKHLWTFCTGAFPDNEAAREAVRDLARLHEQRLRADYRLDRLVAFDDADDAVSRAREAVAILSDAEV